MSPYGFGRFIDGGISLALSIPVLFVALFVIAASGQQWGIWAFILGLALTGWSEAARMVREETRQVRSQLFIEAATALGASAPQIVLGHVLPQIVPLIWVLLAFEVSSTLLVTAELGVLGYFVNSVWIAIGDWVGIRASGSQNWARCSANLQAPALASWRPGASYSSPFWPSTCWARACGQSRVPALASAPPPGCIRGWLAGKASS